MKFFRLSSGIFRIMLLIGLALIGVWCVGAMYYTIAWTGWQRCVGTLLFAAAEVSLLIAAIRTRSFLPVFDWAFLELLVIGYFTSLTPQECFRGTKWQTPWGRRASVIFDGSRAEIRDVRDFVYRTEHDYDVRYITVRIDLNEVRSMDVALSHWDGLTGIAHTMLTFGFADGRFLAFSMETRLPVGSSQGFIPGIYKQYEILPIIATEDDLFKLRTNYRGEELFLYRTKATPEQCRVILSALLKAVNRQHAVPEFYNSVTHNCNFGLIMMLRWLVPGFTDDIRLLFNGYSDELLYDLNYLEHRRGESFRELKRRRRANDHVTASPNYSEAIRTDLL